MPFYNMCWKGTLQYCQNHHSMEWGHPELGQYSSFKVIPHSQRDILPTAIHLTHFYRFCHFGHPCHRSSMLFLLLTHIASAVVQIWTWKSHSYASSKSIGVAFGRNCGCRETFEFRWNSTSSGRHWCTKRCNGWYLQRSRLHFSARNLFSSKVPCQYLPLSQKYLSHKIWPLSGKFYKKLSSCLRLYCTVHQNKHRNYISPSVSVSFINIFFSQRQFELFELEEERKLRAFAAARLKLLLWSQNFCNLASLQNCSASRGWMALNAAVPRSKQLRFPHFVHIVHD